MKYMAAFSTKKKKKLNEAASLSTQISPHKASTLLKLFSSKFLLYIKITSTLRKCGVCRTKEETTSLVDMNKGNHTNNRTLTHAYNVCLEHVPTSQC